ncbi:hypothetical protein HL42_0783 [Trichophyton rubrum]|nr:hypothetical protein HL42_0783 [Trichophyton rubrum]
MILNGRAAASAGNQVETLDAETLPSIIDVYLSAVLDEVEEVEVCKYRYSTAKRCLVAFLGHGVSEPVRLLKYERPAISVLIAPENNTGRRFTPGRDYK